jgi:hypothetical protein
MYIVWKEKVRLIAGLSLDRSALDRKVCSRSHVTAYKTYGAAMKAMVARVTHVSRVYVDTLDRGALDPGPHTTKNTAFTNVATVHFFFSN